jgi:hypothetical protein
MTQFFRPYNSKLFSEDQCTRALRAMEYEVEKAAQLLKIDKLIEMGLCADRSSAARALASNEWNVTETALKLVS